MEESFRETLEKLYIGPSRLRNEELAGDGGCQSPNTDVQPVWKFTNTLEAFEKDIKQEQHEKVCFEVGDQARFKKVATEEMKKHQDDIDVDWVPLLEDMKSRKCTISEVQSKHVRVTTEDDYEWDVHPDLLEAMFEEHHEKCFKIGDRVRVKPIDEIRMKPLQHRHGIPWDPELLKAANKGGVVDKIEDGRKVYIKTDEGKEILCCRPLLEDATEGPPRRPQSRTRQQQESRGFRLWDEVCVKKDLKDGEMKMLQADHGGWDPRMRTEIGKVGSVVRFYPTGDLCVQMNDFPRQWCFNPECLTLLKRVPFEIGNIVQIKDMPSSKMKSLQEPCGGWVPLMEDMKLKQCTIKQVSPGQVVVKTPDEYIWVLNTDLLEVVPADRVEMKDASSISRCFREGDTVRIVDLPNKEMKKLLTHHGIRSDNALLAKNQVGQVLEVHRGREVVIQLQSMIVTCCRPILELVKETDVPKDDGEVADEDLHSLGVEGEEYEKLLGGVMKVTRTIMGEITMPVGITVEPITPFGLLKATANGDLSLTKEILKRHPNWVDVMSEDGQVTALIKACVSGSMETVMFLLEKGANVNLENKNGHTPAMIAAKSGQYNILTLLMSHGAHITSKEGKSVLISVLERDPTTPSKECFYAVYQKCTIEDIQFQDQDGFAAIHAAALSGKEYAVEELLTRDPDGGRRRTEPDQLTILHLAAGSPYSTPSMLEIILNKGGCDINIRSSNGATPVVLAAYNGNLDSVKYLISKGADFCVHDKSGTSILHLACSGLIASATSLDTLDVDKVVNNYLEIISVLIEKGLSLDNPNNDGITPEEILTDRNMRAAVLARAKKVFKTTFVVNINGENQSSSTERILQDTLASFRPSSKDVSSLPDESEIPGDIVELGSTSYVTQSRLKESKKIAKLRDIFASHGAIITDMTKGSLRLNAVVTTERQLERICVAYENGELEKKMTELMITDETTRTAGCKITLKLGWNSQEFQKGQDFFESMIKTTKKSAWIDHTKSEIIVEDTGVCLEIPSGAIPEGKKEKLTISVLWNGECPPMTDDQFIIGPRVLLEPEGMQFEKPVTLTIPHSSKNLSANCLKITEKQNWDAKWECVFDGATEGHSKDIQVTSSTVKVRMNHFTLESFLQSLSSSLLSSMGFAVSAPTVPASTEPKPINMYAHSHMQTYWGIEGVLTHYILKVYVTLSNCIPDDEKGKKSQCADPQRFSIDPGKAMSITAKMRKPQVGWSISEPTKEVSEKSIKKSYCKKEFWLEKTDTNNAECDIAGTIEGITEDEAVLDEFHFHSRHEACNNSAVLDLVPIGNHQCIPARNESQVQQSWQQHIHTNQAAAAHTPQQQSIQHTNPTAASNSTTFPGAASFPPFPGGIAPGIIPGQTIPGMPKGLAVLHTSHETVISDGRVQTIQIGTTFKNVEPAETDLFQKVEWDQNGLTKTKVLKTPQSLWEQLQKCRTEIFDMVGKVKGIAFLLNNMNFVDPTRQRKGSEIDFKNMKHLLKQLGYHILDFEDLPAVDMIAEFDNFETAIEEANPPFKSAMCVLMSHGKEDSIEGTDGKHLDLRKCRAKLADCEKLNGKPKIIITEACRGKFFQTKFTTDGPGANAAKPVGYVNESSTDFLEIHSTMKGKAAMLCNKGSPFMQSVIDVLLERAHVRHVYDMMPLINSRTRERSTREELVTNPDGTETVREIEQVSSGTGHVSKHLYFLPGIE